MTIVNQNQRKLLLQLLPGFIPLIIFVAADDLWGTTVGLIVAVAFGLGELIWYWIKDKRFDKFILLDTLLIVILGLVSIVLDNAVFFKLKPALIGVIMCIVFGISAYTPANILMNMSKRYMKDMVLSDSQYHIFKVNIKIMFWMFVAYTMLVFYSVWFMNKEAWAFISGGLLYILFGAFFLFQLIQNKIKMYKQKLEEWLPLVNEKGEVIGKAPRSICHSDKQYLHPVVHLHVVNKKGELYLQKRPMHKIQPGKWDTAVGGHISFGEDLEIALKREAQEEIGLTDFKVHILGQYIWESTIEREMVYSFISYYDGELKPNKEELTDGRFWSVAEISEKIGKEIFTPNFEKEFIGLLVKKLS